MARPDSIVYDLPSLIDRLNDDDPKSQSEVRRPPSMTEMKDSLLRDVAYLFNSRQTVSPELAGFPELSKSVAVYGL